MKFSPALPLKLWIVQSGLLIQCTVFFSLSLELFHPATKTLLPLNRHSLCQPPPSSWKHPSTLCFSEFSFRYIRQMDCAVFVPLDLLISLFPTSSSFILGAASDKIAFILKCWNTFQGMDTPHFLFDLSARGHWAVFLDFVYNTAMDMWL